MSTDSERQSHIEKLASGTAEERAEAARGLGGLSTMDQATIEALILAFDDVDTDVVEMAIWALEMLHPPSEDAVVCQNSRDSHAAL